MASSLAVKRFLSSNNLLSNPLLRPVASTAFRSFNTDVMIGNITPVDTPEQLSLDGNITSLNSKRHTLRRITGHDRRPCTRGTGHDRLLQDELDRPQVQNTVYTFDKLMENSTQILEMVDKFTDNSLQIQNMVDKLDKLTDNSLQIQNMVDKLDKLMDKSLLSVARLNAKETEDALHLRVDMPGLSKEDVKISVEQNTLTIKGESAKESEEEAVRRFTNSINLPEKKLYKFAEIKAEMKNGVLKVIVPKMKEEERKDVIINVKVE